MSNPFDNLKNDALARFEKAIGYSACSVKTASGYIRLDVQIPSANPDPGNYQQNLVNIFNSNFGFIIRQKFQSDVFRHAPASTLRSDPTALLTLEADTPEELEGKLKTIENLIDKTRSLVGDMLSRASADNLYDYIGASPVAVNWIEYGSEATDRQTIEQIADQTEQLTQEQLRLIALKPSIKEAVGDAKTIEAALGRIGRAGKKDPKFKPIATDFLTAVARATPALGTRVNMALRDMESGKGKAVTG